MSRDKLSRDSRDNLSRDKGQDNSPFRGLSLSRSPGTCPCPVGEPGLPRPKGSEGFLPMNDGF